MSSSIVLAYALSMTALPALAQSDRGTITGTVSDPAGAVVPSAAVNVTNAATGAIYDTVTTGTGNYTLPSLPSGHYNLQVTAQGFSRYVQEGIEVQVAQTARVDVVLKIGQSTDTVTIMADAPLLRTENAEQSQTLNGDDINKLPLTLGGNNLYGTRNPLAGLSLAPGVAQVTGTNFQFRTNGSTDTARFLLDGQDMTTAGMTSQHLSESHPSVEAVSEVTLQSSNFAAEFGQVQGGLVNFTTRSGTNQLHGAAYDYYTNEFMNAGRPFTDDGKGHLIRPRQRNNDYGFSVGGPVWLPKLYNGKNKTFFFFNFDQFRNKSTVSGSAATVPTAAYRQGDFSGALTGRTLTDSQGRQYQENAIFDPASNTTVNGQVVRTQFVGNVIPTSRLDPVALKIQALIPMPTSPGNTNNLAVVDEVASTTTLPSLKFDQNIGERNKISFFWTEWINNVPKSTGDGIPFPISNTRQFITHSNTERLTFDRTITPTLLLHLGVGYLRYAHVDSSPDISQNYDAPGKLGFVGGVKNANGNTGFPGMTGLSAPQGGFLSGNGSSIGWTNGVNDWDDKPTATGSVSLVRGNHTYKAGGEWHKDIWTFRNLVGASSNAFSAAETAQPYLNTTNIGGGSIGFPYASFLLGAADSGSVHPVSDPQVRKWAWSMYVQDTWKITRKITLDYGVRWDYQTGWHEIHDRSSSFAAGVPNPAAGNLLGATAYEGSGAGHCNCSFTNTYPYAIGPRLGLAWQVNSKTVVRAGWGLVYGQTPVLNYFTTATVGVGFNTLTFANSTGLFGDPAYYLKDGLSYNPAALYAATYDPGVRPQPGTINSPPSYLSPQGGRPPRINQWNIALQREVLPNLSLEAAYVANRSVWILANNTVELNALSPQMVAARGFDITNPTDQAILNGPWTAPAAAARGIKAPYPGYPTSLTAAQTLRPYPQFGNIGVQWMDNGDSWYDALQMKLTKRYSRGLQVVSSFSWQKETEYGINVPNNVYNVPVNKTISAYSQPLNFAIGFDYQTPALHLNRFVKAVLRDWTFGGFLSYSSGLPIESPIGQNNLQTLLFQANNTSISSGQNSSTSASGTFMNRVPGQPLFLKDLNCHCIDPNKDFVLNPAAWSNPAPGTFGTAAAYYNDYRYQRHPIEQLSFGRLFRIREQMSLQLRIEFFNAFNRANMADPISVNALATQSRNSAGVPTAGFGYINSQSLGNGSTLNNNTGLGGNPRQGQLLLRFQF
ncbi:MAG TPA: TonB-dependent receptor [Bryobacteraceae bacterium]|nr:TonB-dependent receptor [Bryobacteraceae bacterium]